MRPLPVCTSSLCIVEQNLPSCAHLRPLPWLSRGTISNENILTPVSSARIKFSDVHLDRGKASISGAAFGRERRRGIDRARVRLTNIVALKRVYRGLLCGECFNWCYGGMQMFTLSLRDPGRRRQHSVHSLLLLDASDINSLLCRLNILYVLFA